MSRNINGNYSLPAGNPVAANTTILAGGWANPTMDDIAAALTDSLSRTGLGGMLAPFLNADGTQANPGISWTNEQTSGWYRSGTGTFTYSVAGADIFTITSAGIALASGKAFSNFNTSGPAIFNGTVQFNEDISIEAGNVLNTDAINSPSSSMAFNLASVNRMTLSATGLAVTGAVSATGTLRSTTQTPPSSGAGTELFYDTGGATGYLIAYDRTGAAYKDLNINSSFTSLGINGASIVAVSTTGLTVTGNITQISGLPALNFASDAAAGAGGVAIGGLYHNAGVVHVRLV